MTRMALALAATALLAAPALLTAQSLGEVAAREKERRERETRPAKAYGENDLRNGGTVANTTGTATPAAEPSPGASPAADGENAAAEPSAEQREANQKAWQANRTRIQGEIARITAAIGSFQARLNDNTGPMYGPGRQSVVENLERAKADLVRAQADLDTNEAEGRKNGYQ
jgi:hypothetical protein